MKIHEPPAGAGSATAAAVRSRSPETSESRRAGGPADTLELSRRSLEVGRARSVALAAPEVREELVAGLQNEVFRGEYAVAGSQVAPRMIRDHLAEGLR